MGHPPPLVSVVVPTYGRPGLLRSCVEATLRQECKFDFEVLVVDDGGSPPASEALSPDPRLTVIRVPNGGPAKARNEGIRRSRGEYIAFIDDDCAPEPGWLQAGIDAFADGVIMVHGSVRPPRPASPLAYHFIDTGDAPGNVTANLVVRREALVAIGGFDEGFPHAAGEDFDLCWRLERLGERRFAVGARVVHALIPISWRKRRSRPRVSVAYFRLYGLHPERLPEVTFPGLGWAQPALLRHFPPLWLGAFVMLSPLLTWARQARRTDWVSAVTELAASCVNAADVLRLARTYVDVYRQARAEGGSPGLDASRGERPEVV